MKGLFLLLLSLLPVVVIQAQTVTDTTVYQLVEEMPQFPGGDDSLLNFIQHNIQYDLLNKGVARPEIYGTVYINFIVEADGRISNVKTLRPMPFSAFNDEAMRIIKSMPHWKPGTVNGIPTRVQMNVPVTFKLI